ncbi:MAG: benzoate-CoA ligase family protein [Rhodospirillales bacterium]|nr:benzoate-CoA ligase family protein [Rhodospirillales bacterium]
MPAEDNTTDNAAWYFLHRHIAEGRGERRAFADPHRARTYAALAREAERFAAALAAAGVGRERRIALVMLDTVDFPAAFWGALGAGVVPVPVNTLLTPEQTAYILADSRAELAVVSAPLLERLRPELDRLPALRRVVVAAIDGGAPAISGPKEIAWDEFLAAAGGTAPVVDASADEVAFWLYSSGSTGMPKGARHLHASLRATADTYAARVLGIAPDDVMFSAAKLFFAYGLGNGMTFPMSVGAATVLLPDRPTPEAVLATMARERPTIFGGVPTLYAGLVAQAGLGRGAGSDRLRRCISAGEALPEPIARRWAEIVGVEILDGLGSTEMLHIFLSNAPGDIGYGTSGRAVPGYELRVVDAEGRDVPDGTAGELIVRGPSAAEGYWNQRAKSQTTFRGEWTWTGDTYVREADGRYRYQGRADDMMKVGGIWVSPFEVEAALLAHQAVQEAAVVGQADTDGLTKPKAFLVLRDPATDADRLREELKALVQAKIGVWKYPRWIEIAESLPKTATGKIQRYKLRAGSD